LKVAGSTSTKNGSAPHARTELAVATNEWLTVRTTSPDLTPTARSARCRALVPLEQAHERGAPTTAEKAASNARTLGPWTSQPEAMASGAARCSSAPRSGTVMGRACSMRLRIYAFSRPRARKTGREGAMDRGRQRSARPCARFDTW
jgi:hypothetical protein